MGQSLMKLFFDGSCQKEVKVTTAGGACRWYRQTDRQCYG